jgi:hypothetical protein
MLESLVLPPGRPRGQAMLDAFESAGVETAVLLPSRSTRPEANAWENAELVLRTLAPVPRPGVERATARSCRERKGPGPDSLARDGRDHLAWNLTDALHSRREELNDEDRGFEHGS